MKAKMVSYRVRRVNFRETESGQLRLLTKRIEPKKYRIALIHLSLLFGLKYIVSQLIYFGTQFLTVDEKRHLWTARTHDKHFIYEHLISLMLVLQAIKTLCYSCYEDEKPY